MKKTTAPLQPGLHYHIYNRGNNREDLFVDKRNYPYFLTLYAKYVEPIADTYAYCLLKNHFHLLVRIKTEEEYQALRDSETRKVSKTIKFDPSRGFSNLFNAYAKAINKVHRRTGSLFEERFGRIPVTNESYCVALIFYIHYNPQKHGLVKDFRNWQWSSYHALAGTGKTRLKRESVWDICDGEMGFKELHHGLVDEKKLYEVVDEEFDDET